ncbi:MAG: restriction endonuclease [Candidatus Aenigmarchaeota archaeon]|nr:restriction endonuclease [Candidatus Aenigmarchaeota archaeon]
MRSQNEIGDDFEKEVALYYQVHADYVDINRRIKGRSGVIHELDIYAVKKGLFGITETAVECKYKNNGDKVTQEEVANFVVKLLDTCVRRGDFVTNSDFTNYARLLGNFHRLRLVEGRSWNMLCQRYGLPQKH